MDKVSVIVLIYDVEKYLTQCLESIINQTYKNLEIILSVGTGKDRCEDICEEYAKTDSRIVLAKSKPQGIAKARNLGLEYVTGTYVVWVDGDDWIEKTMIENLMAAIIMNEADISICGHYKEYIGRTDKVLKVRTGFMDKTELYRQILSMESFGLELWNKMFKYDIIKNLKFLDTKEAEDRFWIYKVFERVDRYALTNTLEYHFRMREDSCSRTQENAEISLKADIQMCDIIAEYDSTLEKEINCFLFFSYYRAIYSDIDFECFDYRKDRKYLENLRKCAKDVLCCPKIRKEDRLKAFLVKVNYRFLIRFMKWRKKVLRRKESNDYYKNTV